MAKRAPKSQITDYDWGHLQQLFNGQLTRAKEALLKANALDKTNN